MAKLIGTDPNQVPTNSDLGTMAYQDYDVVAPQFLAGGRRNLIINGAMQVWQRGTSFTGLGNGDSGYVLDRFQWREGGTTTAVYTVEKSTDAPNGFSSSCKATVTTAGTDSSGNNRIETRLEAQDLQHIGFGTSDAKPLTLSFWAKSSITGQYAVNLYRPDNTARGISLTYNLDSANTWKHIVLSIPADTSQTVDNNTNAGLNIAWFMNATSNYQSATGYPWVNYNSTMYAKGQEAQVGQTSGATWQITGVQLEVGSVATPFEHRSFGEELALCQRYYYAYRYNGSGGHAYFAHFAGYDADDAMGVMTTPVPMRTTPSISYSGTFMRYGGQNIETAAHTVVIYNYTDNDYRNNYTLNYDNSSNAFSGHAGGAMLWGVLGDSTDNYIELDAEL